MFQNVSGSSCLAALQETYKHKHESNRHRHRVGGLKRGRSFTSTCAVKLAALAKPMKHNDAIKETKVVGMDWNLRNAPVALCLSVSVNHFFQDSNDCKTLQNKFVLGVCS